MTSRIVAISRKKTGRASREDDSSPNDKPAATEPDALTHALMTRMTENGHTTKELAVELGITYPYLMALARQERKFCDAGRAVLAKAAKYIDVPVAQAYVLSGAMDPKDFFFEDKLPSEVASLYRSLASHKMWSGFCPSEKEWAAMPEKARLLVCLLFQEATQQTFLSSMSVEIPEEARTSAKADRKKVAHG